MEETRKYMRSVPTMSVFEDAVMHPAEYMRTMKELVADSDSPLPWLCRSTLFAEARVIADGQKYLLCAPLKNDSFELVVSSLHVARHNDGFAPFKILPSELIFTTPGGETAECDLLLFLLPEGKPLDAAVMTADPNDLVMAVGRLKDIFLTNGIVVGNMKPSNLIFGRDGNLYPIRCYYLRSGMAEEYVSEEFAKIERYIGMFPSTAAETDEVVRRLNEQFDEIGVLRGMFRRVRRDGLYGFVDDKGEVVIEPRYLSAGYFFEGRSVVNTPSGEGVIDTGGQYIIPPRYDMVDFNTDRCEFTAYRFDGTTERFDYMGYIIKD